MTSVDRGQRLHLVQVEAKFWASVDVRGPDECWPWKRGHGGPGYGSFYVPQQGRHSRQVSAHRFSAELAYGIPPEGAEALHSCDNKSCVNPAHLRWGTHAENMQDAADRGLMFSPKASVTHCPQGHEYTAENTLKKFVTSNGKRYQGRSCRECNRLYLASRRERRRSA